jgi:ABC-type dipeptide/oligopeptide/nickel transport system permease component
MWVFAVRRMLETIPVLIGVILLTFALMQVIPGSAVDARLGQRATAEARANMMRQLGLDRPWYQQLAGYLVLDFGQSMRRDQPARDIVLNRFGNTMLLAVTAMAFAIVFGVSMGILCAVMRNTWVDHALMFLALMGISMPVFWFGMVLLVMASSLGWRYLTDDGTGNLLFLILPAVTLGTRSVAYIARMTRSAMLEVLSMDFLRTARAKGLAPWQVVWRHALTNALIPVITIIGLDFAAYLTGAVLTESVFNYPGIGRELVEAIRDRDTNVILCGVVVVTFTFVLVNLLVDILYGVVDPRIRRS